ncbi:hypothetical protein [Kitasatospora sp. HPMI-4]|uniref:hypothetical protein n=1 Tax=Kitasatospora sp. HPMI-4 TaxID=3448443 RepID=UPI003F1BC626
MLVHFIAPARYLRASHDIIRHPRLKGVAKTLLLWALSLPFNSKDTILSIGRRMPEGREAVSRARGQLIDEGFLHIRRFQHPTKGTWVTKVMVTSVPLTDPEEVAAAWAAAEAAAATAPSSGNPTVGEQVSRVVGTSPKGENNEENTSLPAQPPPVPEPTRLAAPDPSAPDPTVPDPSAPDPSAPEPAATEPAATEPAATEPAAAEAARLLCGLGARDRRLRLGLAEALELAPLVCEWLARDAGPHRLQEALLDGLPDRVHAPAAFLRKRLEVKMPAAPVLAPPPRLGHECAHCRVPTPAPGVCRPCAGLNRSPDPDPAAVARTRQGAARARELMRSARATALVGVG